MVAALLASLAGLVLAGVAAGAISRRPIARVAFRGFLRRPGQSALVVGGLLVASLVLAASLVAGDAQEAMFEDNVYRVWGSVDIVVGSLSGRPFSETNARKVLEDESVHALSDGRAVRLQLPASVEAPAQKTRETLINLIGIDPSLDSTLGEFVAETADSIKLGAGSVVINRRLARRLRVKAGDPISFTTISVEAKPVPFASKVAAVVENAGKADWQLRPNAFVLLSDLQAVTKARGFVNQVVLSAGGPDRAPRQVKALEGAAVGALNALSGVQPNAKIPQGFRVAGAKAQSLKNNREQSRFFRTVLGSLGGLVALTSVALIVNLFVMLGEERRSELGTMRALGLRRWGLVQLGLTEGVLYAITAAVLGAFTGAFLGRYLAGAMVDVFSTFVRDFAIEFAKPKFQFRAATLITAGTGGFLVSVVSVALVSYRTSRLSVVAAIRGLPERRSRRRRRWPQILAISVGAILLLAGILGGIRLLVLIGGTFAIIGVSTLAGMSLSTRVRATAGAAATLVFGLWAYILLPDFEHDFDSAFGVVITAAVVITIAAVILMAANLTILEKLAALFGPRARAVIRTATAYPVAYRFRTAMSMSMFAVVIYMVGAFAIWGGIGSGNFATQSGGFDVLARSSFPVANLTAQGASEVVGIYYTRYNGGYKVGKSMEITFPVALYGVDEKFAAASRYKFTDKLKGLNSRQVLEQLASRKDTAIIDIGTNPGGARVGDALEIRTDRGPRRFEVIGILNESYLQGLFLSKSGFAELYPNLANDSAWLVKARPGVSPASLSTEIEAARPGVDSSPVREIFDENAQGQRAFVGIFQVLLKLGLVIGISGLAIGSIRTVLERRQAVGILRALGFRRSMVGAWLMLETVLVATLGCAIGLATGLFGTYFLVNNQLPNLQVVADWGQIGTTLLIVYVSTLAFTALPAWRAASLQPAEAVRYVE